MLRTLLFVLLSVIPVVGFCQKPAYFERVKNEKGLNSNYIQDILQRDNGFIWMATSDGLSRFDGYEFVNFVGSSNVNSLPSSWINTIYEDSHERLWVGTDKGLALLNSDEISFTRFENDPNTEFGLVGNSIYSIDEDTSGTLWVATNWGINRFRSETQDFEFIPIEHPAITSKPQTPINFILADKSTESGLWIATEQNLFFYDHTTKTFSLIQLDGLPKSVELMAADFDSTRNIWISTAEHGVFKFNPSSQQVTRYSYDANNSNSISTDYTWNIMVDREDRVWVGTWGDGLNRINPETNQVTRYRHDMADERTIPSNLTTDIIQDSTGLIWVGTYNGIAHFQPYQVVENFRPIPFKKNSLSSEMVWSFEESKEAIWIGTTEGLNRREKSNGNITRFYTGNNQDSENYTTVWTMKKAPQDNLWLGTEYGPAWFDTASNELSYFYEIIAKESLTESQVKLLKKPVWALLVENETSIWVGTNDGYFYLVDRKLGVLTDFSDALKNNLGQKSGLELLNIVKDNDLNFWLSTTTGLHFFNSESGQLTHATLTDGSLPLKNEWIYTMVKHSNNRYWIGTQKLGLMLIELNNNASIKQLIHIDERIANMNDRGVYSIFPVSQTLLWFNGVKNMYEYNIEKKELKNFGSEAFSPENHFHESTQFIDSEGYIYSGSSRGANRFKIEGFKRVEEERWKIHPKLVFTEVESNSYYISSAKRENLSGENNNAKQPLAIDKPLFKTSKITLPYDQNMITVRFAALNYAVSQNSKYAYRLVGINEQWIDLKERREVTLTNLTSGSYRIEVKATAGRSAWNNNHGIMNFEIETAFWWSGLAYSIYFLIVSLFAYYGYRAWQRHLITKYALLKTEDSLDQALWGSGDEHWEWDLVTNHVTSKNRFTSFEPIRNLSAGKFKNECKTIHPDDLAEVNRSYDRIACGKTQSVELHYRRKTRHGRWVWLFDRAKVCQTNNKGKPVRLRGTTRNVDEQKRTELTNLLLASAFKSTSDASVILDADFKMVSINPAMIRITGYDQSVVGEPVNRKLISSKKNNRDGQAFCELIVERLSSQNFFRGEAWIIKSDRKKIPIDLRIAPVNQWDNKNQHYIATLTDIEYRISAEQELKRLANFDSLTGLANRTQLYRQLSYGILQADRDRRHLSVLFIDLDHFKNINDSLGHSAGDLLLQSVAERLKQCVRRTDVVARLGGDEFTIGVLGTDTIEDVVIVAQNILTDLSRPFKLADNDVVISPSIGIAIYRVDGNDVETLLRNADIAMYHAKNNGRNKYEFFTEAMNERLINRIELEKRIRRALQSDEFVLHYQPKYSTSEQKITGFEALVRWVDPDLGIIYPDNFIPTAEETGLIIPLGKRILELACQQIKEWQKLYDGELSLAVNLSAIQFGDKALLPLIQQLINDYGISASNLELEITESALIENMDYTIKTLTALRALGVHLSLDDFGTGYSSLNYLKQFPINTLKIDRSFMREIETQERDAKMVASIVSLAHNLDIEVVGEGVETQAQLDMMSDFHVEQVQGFFLSKPVDVKTAEQLIRENNSRE